MDPVAMELVGVRIELPTNVPILLLREGEGSRYLPIWIGPNEATAIALALQGVEPQRPMTHDLLALVVTALDAEVVRVDVTELVDGTFFANLVLDQKGQDVTISARPSDAIALAARTKAPIFADRGLLDEAGVEIEEDGQEEEIERFREFLEDITPEDFESGTPPGSG
ncbi:MAG: bifunctional nuclease family protein [Acidimicrobiia bacterium]|nr:bifunctional nuclease family protein [Acidimicrobiia bacterium]